MKRQFHHRMSVDSVYPRCRFPSSILGNFRLQPCLILQISIPPQRLSHQSWHASAYSLRSQAASETISDDTRAVLALDVRSLRDQIVSLANSQVRGRYIFAGSAVGSAPFSLEGDSVVYHGDGVVGRIGVAEGVDVPMSYSGDTIFDPVFSSIDSLLTGIDSNDIASIRASLDKFSSAFSNLARLCQRHPFHQSRSQAALSD